MPKPLLNLQDDFDWNVRDFESFRRFMLEELAARLPERKRWTAADVEVVLIEVLAYVLDQLSDMLDRVTAEGRLNAARRPESVRRLLKLIGFDALGLAWRNKEAPFDTVDESDPRKRELLFEQYWLRNPSKMEQARLRGPRELRTQRRMVTLDDFVTQVEQHPLVRRAYAWQEWGGAWMVIHVAVINWNRTRLDDTGIDYPSDLGAVVQRFHRDNGFGDTSLPLPDLALSPTVRGILTPYLEAVRMCGQPVVLTDAQEVGVFIAFSIQVNANYFQSEVRLAVEQTLGTGPEGFFSPGKLGFGEDLCASDLYQALMNVDGVDNVCINSLKRLGERYADKSGEGRIVLQGLEVAVCDNDPSSPERGYFTLTLRGGRKG